MSRILNKRTGSGWGAGGCSQGLREWPATARPETRCGSRQKWLEGYRMKPQQQLPWYADSCPSPPAPPAAPPASPLVRLHLVHFLPPPSVLPAHLSLLRPAVLFCHPCLSPCLADVIPVWGPLFSYLLSISSKQWKTAPPPPKVVFKAPISHWVRDRTRYRELVCSPVFKIQCFLAIKLFKTLLYSMFLRRDSLLKIAVRVRKLE